MSLKPASIGYITAAILAMALFAPAAATVHVDGESISAGTYRIIHSEILGEDRELSVYLPAGYDESGESYPVLYVLDGDMLSRLMKISAAMEMLDGAGKCPQMIVVGIPASTNAARDYFPVAREDRPNTGKADDFLHFLTDELIPWVEANYRTVDYRILSGASNSGLFTIYTMLIWPSAFSGYIAASPAVGWFSDFMNETAERALTAAPPITTRLYMNYGTDDIESIVTGAMPSFVDVFTAHAPAELGWTTEIIENGGHVPFISEYNGLCFVFPDWKYPEDKIQSDGLPGLQDYYAKLSDKYGFTVKVPSGLLMDLAGPYMQAGENEKALTVLKTYAELYPRSTRAFYLLGVIYQRLEQADRAVEAFEKALEISPEFAPARRLLEQLKSEG